MRYERNLQFIYSPSTVGVGGSASTEAGSPVYFRRRLRTGDGYWVALVMSKAKVALAALDRTRKVSKQKPVKLLKSYTSLYIRRKS